MNKVVQILTKARKRLLLQIFCLCYIYSNAISVLGNHTHNKSLF